METSRARRPARPPTPQTQRAAATPNAPASRLAWLQRTAGNSAVTAVIQRDGDAAPGRLDQAASDLYGWLVANAVNTERVLHTILLQKDPSDQGKLRRAYDEKFTRSLVADLERLGGNDTIRAQAYLQHGTLRDADKIYIAIHGALTDETTVVRVVASIGGQCAKAEEDFRTTYGPKGYPTDYVLPNGESSRIGGALMAEMLSATFATRFRTAAVLAYGKTRPADDVKIATVAGFNDQALLFTALQSQDPKTLSSEFAASYKEPLVDYLTRETSLHTKKRALMLLQEPNDQRLIRTLEIATDGYTTADADFIFDAVAHADAAQLAAFKKAVENKDPRLRNMDATFGGMSKEERSRFDALVGVGANGGILGDPVVVKLRGLGGTNGDAIFDVLRNSSGVDYLAFKAAHDADTGPLHQYMDPMLTAPQKGWLRSYVFTDLRSRLQFVMTNPGHDEYILFLLASFTTANDRRQLATDASFGANLANLSTATKNKILLQLEPSSLTPQERAVWLDAAVKRETATGVGSVTAAGAALEDENRELQAAKERATAGGKQPTAEEQAEIDRLASRTATALTMFVQYRDQLEAAVSTAVDIAVGLLLTVGSGGAAAPELVLAAIARAAVASAMAKVVSRKLVLGDRFDVVGADGAAAFVTGAVDGALNVVGPALGKNLLPASVHEMAEASARSAGPKSFTQFAATTGAKMTENAATSGISSAVETLSQDKTWADGFDQGMRAAIVSAATGAATGAAVGALPGSAAAMVAMAGSLEQFEEIIAQFPEAAFTLEKVTLTPPLPDASVQQIPVQRVGDPKFSNKEIGDEFERYVDERLWKDGLGGQVPKMNFVISGEHNIAGNGIDRIGVVMHADGTMTVYHFEMKFRSEPAGGAANPSTKLGEPARGTQLGHDWTQGALTDLVNASSSHPPAMAVFDATRAMLAKAKSAASGKPFDIESVTHANVREFLAASLNAKRVVVVPLHVDTRQLLRQIVDLIKSNLDVSLATVNVTKAELAARRAKRAGK
ncbi:hypothetical protein [Agromyces sp. NPDC058110]|uniref:hypothetical protein n=1 Tax=Agromyces sp. NPDC058110 TaxID=3346345 RepID=UPI0036DDB470